MAKRIKDQRMRKDHKFVMVHGLCHQRLILEILSDESVKRKIPLVIKTRHSKRN